VIYLAKRLDENGLLYLLSKLLLLFVRKEAGKGLSTNDLTDDLKQMILAQFSGSWNDLTDRPSNVSTWTNDAGYQTAVQVSSAITTALVASGYQTAAQVEALIEAALRDLDTEIFVVVAVLPDPAAANPNKIYIAPNPVLRDNVMKEWIVVDGAWEELGSAQVSLDGYFNEQNLVPISNAEIDSMIASLAP
jgi:hypothetical protein